MVRAVGEGGGLRGMGIDGQRGGIGFVRFAIRVRCGGSATAQGDEGDEKKTDPAEPKHGTLYAKSPADNEDESAGVTLIPHRRLVLPWKRGRFHHGPAPFMEPIDRSS
jgi:hypothetical protein